MSATQPSPDPLEAAINAFQNMSAPNRPSDEQMCARLDALPESGVRSISGRFRSKTRSGLRLLVPCALIAVLLIGGIILLLRKSESPKPAQVAGPVSKDASERVAGPPNDAHASTKRELLRVKSLKQQVAESQVIVVATAVNLAPAPPRRPGDLPETLIRFRVKRVLKGTFAVKEITTRTPSGAAELVGKDWIVMLSPEYIAGKHSYASCLWIKAEPTVQAILSNKNRVEDQPFGLGPGSDRDCRGPGRSSKTND